MPEGLLREGHEYYEKLSKHSLPSRALSTFATTMGNIALVQSIRSALGAGTHFEYSTGAAHWYETALGFADRTRWARFGKCQNLYLAKRELNNAARKDIEDVIGSVGREYQNRVEDRSKALSKVTEYMCMIMLGRQKESKMSSIAGLVEVHSGKVTARTMYSQFRKQNVSKDDFLDEFHFLQETMDVRETFRRANSPKKQTEEKPDRRRGSDRRRKGTNVGTEAVVST